MRKLFVNFKLHFSLKTILVSLIFILAFFLRVYHLEERTIFNADQEWLAFRAQDVLNGDAVLLGPTTSVGRFSIGPGYVYLLSIVSMFTNSAPISGAYLSVMLGLISLVLLYLFVRYFIDQNTAYLMLFLTSISSLFIFNDQQPWAPSLFHASQLIILFGTYISNKKQIGYPIMALGLMLGFQSHFGIVLSLISMIAYLLIVRPIKPSTQTLVVTVFILLLGLLPNIIFDITHGFVNFWRLFEVADNEGVSYFVSFNKILNVLVTNTISIIYPLNRGILDAVLIKSLFALVLVNAISLLRSSKLKNLSLLLLITALLPAVLFYLKQGKFSEYYLMMSFPSLLLLLSLSIYRIINRRLLIVFIVLISVYLNYGQFKNKYVSWNLKAKQTIAKRIVNIAGNNNYDISLNSKLGDQFGFDYIFKHSGIKANIPPKKGETKIFSVIIPQGFDGMVGKESYDGIGLLWSGI